MRRRRSEVSETRDEVRGVARQETKCGKERETEQNVTQYNPRWRLHRKKWNLLSQFLYKLFKIENYFFFCSC